MTQNAVLLKRAMAYLGLGNVGMSSMISACREDGKTTAPETISRYLNGVNPVDPNLIGWLTELVRVRALARGGALMKWPTKGTITIAVANQKGGVGITTVSQNLSFVVAETYRLNTTHIAAGARGDSEVACRTLRNLRLDAQVMSYQDTLAYRPSRHEVVIVDVARDAVYEALASKDEVFLRQLDADLFLVPADFGSLFDIESTKQFVDIVGLRGLVRLLHRPRLMDMNFAALALDAGLDVSSDLFCPFFIPQSGAYPPHIPFSRYGSWQVSDQEHHHVSLFQYVVEQVGGEVTLPSDTESALRVMDLASLLDFVTQGEQ